MKRDGAAWSWAATALLVACANGEQLSRGQIQLFGDGGSDSGMAGGAPNGGAPENAGGSLETNGGATAGGVPASGGAVSTGGAPTTGAVGASGAGAAMGGAVTTGGVGGRTTGGTSGSAGTAATGGALSSGGTTGNGGAPSSGGATASGGQPATCPTKQKTCGGLCVPELPANGCSSTGCAQCSPAAPDHGIQTCNDQGTCDFDCLSGFQKNGSECTSGTGSGGAGGGTSVVCAGAPCLPCLPSFVACCSNLPGNLCFCAPSNQAAMFCM